MNDSVAENLLSFTSEGYKTVSEAFSTTRRFSWDDCTPLQWIVKDGMSVLDVGCGNGRLVELLKNKDIEYTGIDLNQYFVQIAQEKFGAKNRNFYQGDILTLNEVSEIANRAFDVVFSIAVLHHLPSRQMRLNALQKMHDRMSSNGTLFLTSWNLWRLTVKEKSVWKYALERSLLDPKSYGREFDIDYKDLSWRDLMTTWKSGSIRAPLYYYSFRCSELTRLCVQAGFDVVDCYYSRKGYRAHWWDATNMCLIARRK